MTDQTMIAETMPLEMQSKTTKATAVQITRYGQYPSFACAANPGLAPTSRDALPKVSRTRKSNAALNATSSANCIL